MLNQVLKREQKQSGGFLMHLPETAASGAEVAPAAASRQQQGLTPD